MNASLGQRAIGLDDKARAWKSELTKADVDALLGRASWVEDARRVTVGRLFYVDLLRAVKRWARGFTKDDRDSLRTDALMWLTERETFGANECATCEANAVYILSDNRAYCEPCASETGLAVKRSARAFPLGPSGKLPLRRDWLENGQPSAGAWRAMHAAIKQCAEAPRRIGLAPASELPMEAEALGVLAERESRAEAFEARTAVIIDASAYDLARVLGLPENGARALLAGAYNLSADECADEWGISRTSAIEAVSKGKTILDRRYGDDPEYLLEALRAGVIALSVIREDNARQAILEYARDPRGWIVEEANKAAREWQSGKRALPPQRAALISALVKQLARTESDSESVAERASRIADSIARLLRAESKRASDNARKGIRNGVGGYVDASGATIAPKVGTDIRGPDVHEEKRDGLEALERRANQRAMTDARRAYFAAHPDDWSEADAPPKPDAGNTPRRATRAPDAPMYETEAWTKGLKL